MITKLFLEIFLFTYPLISFAQMMEMSRVKGGILSTVPMSQEGSGTSWQPASTAMYAYHWQEDEWVFMLHGNIFIRYTRQGSDRGGKKFDAPNWFMGMAQYPIGADGQVMFRAMLSLDRMTEGGNGYPLLFQTGETWRGVPLVDRQHPHDLFSELAVAYSHQFDENLSAFVYFGYSGEPALGPPVFMHRMSALNNPDAPISHHWQDATHIAFGVATIGVQFDNLKIDGSLFTGREPDENRFDFDKPRFNSYSGRISYNPADDIALQISSSFLKSPEALEPDNDVHRSTASILYNRPLGENHWWSSAFVWGQNKDDHAGAQNSFLLELQLRLGPTAIYTRLENVQKPRREFGFTVNQDQKENVGEFSLGIKHFFAVIKGADISVGVQGTVYLKSSFFDQYYGRSPTSFQIFLAIHPSLMTMEHHMH